MRNIQKLIQPGLFKDSSAIQKVAGADAGIQLDIFGGGHPYNSLPTETVLEAVDILQRHNKAMADKNWRR